MLNTIFSSGANSLDVSVQRQNTEQNAEQMIATSQSALVVPDTHSAFETTAASQTTSPPPAQVVQSEELHKHQASTVPQTEQIQNQTPVTISSAPPQITPQCVVCKQEMSPDTKCRECGEILHWFCATKSTIFDEQPPPDQIVCPRCNEK